jgi:hypothetical protein
LDSVKNADTITTGGEVELISVLAVFSSDYLYIIVAAVIVTVILAAAAFYFLRIRKK